MHHMENVFDSVHFVHTNRLYSYEVLKTNVFCIWEKNPFSDKILNCLDCVMHHMESAFDNVHFVHTSRLYFYEVLKSNVFCIWEKKHLLCTSVHVIILGHMIFVCHLVCFFNLYLHFLSEIKTIFICECLVYVLKTNLSVLILMSEQK